jgi:hypothetical protein
MWFFPDRRCDKYISPIGIDIDQADFRVQSAAAHSLTVTFHEDDMNDVNSGANSFTITKCYARMHRFKVIE